MSVFKSVLNAALLICAVGATTGCVEDPDPIDPPVQCTAGETRAADDGCNTCTCEPDGSWSCTEIGCGPVCGDDEVTVEGQCRTGCYGDEACGDEERCNAADVCLAPPGAGDGLDAPAVCYGYCVPDEPVDCPAIACDIDCEFGTLRDANGCEICECAPPPACEPVACELFCEHGFQTDMDGCEICVCAEPPMCLPVDCDLYCEHGWAQDEQGCDVCACAEPPVCAEPNAPHYYVGNSVEECTMIDFICAEGTEYFANDCGCGCIGAECFPGDRRDADDGCNTCECAEDGSWACTEIACPEQCPDGQFFYDGACRVGCYGDDGCGDNTQCNAPWLCLSPPADEGQPDGDAPADPEDPDEPIPPQPAVCYGYCEAIDIDG